MFKVIGLSNAAVSDLYLKKASKNAQSMIKANPMPVSDHSILAADGTNKENMASATIPSTTIAGSK